MKKTVFTTIHNANDYSEFCGKAIAITLSEDHIETLQYGLDLLKAQPASATKRFTSISMDCYDLYDIFDSQRKKLNDNELFDPYVDLAINSDGRIYVHLELGNEGSRLSVDSIEFESVKTQLFDDDPRAFIDIIIKDDSDEPENSLITAKMHVFNGIVKDVSHPEAKVILTAKNDGLLHFNLLSDSAIQGGIGVGGEYCESLICENLNFIQNYLIAKSQLVYQLKFNSSPEYSEVKTENTLSNIYNQSEIIFSKEWLRCFILNHDHDFLDRHSFSQCLSEAEKFGFEFTVDGDIMSDLINRYKYTKLTNQDAVIHIIETLVDRGININKNHIMGDELINRLIEKVHLENNSFLELLPDNHSSSSLSL